MLHRAKALQDITNIKSSAWQITDLGCVVPLLLAGMPCGRELRLVGPEHLLQHVALACHASQQILQRSEASVMLSHSTLGIPECKSGTL